MRFDDRIAPMGRYVFGLAAIWFGVCALVFRDFSIWQQIRPLGNLPHPEYLLYVVAIVEIAAGVAILFQRTARSGALALAIVYFFFALLWLPLWIAKPQAYVSLGNFFEQFSMVSGALILYGPKTARIGYYGFALSVVSFMLVQAIYLQATADFIPAWIPFHMFWAVITTVAFALAALALFTNRMSLLAARLTTLMIAGFGVLIWFPAPFAAPHSLTSWAGIAENFGICGAAWIVADYLARRATPQHSS